MHNFYRQINIKVYLQDQKYNSAKRRVHCHKNVILDLLLKESNIFEWQLSFLFYSQRQEIIITYGSYK